MPVHSWHSFSCSRRSWTRPPGDASRQGPGVGWPSGGDQPGDRDVAAVAPPLYGSHHTGQQTVPDADGWMKELNLQVRRRVAAGLGARYVQLEQEFMMARAWEQVAAIRRANRVLAAAELAAAAAELSQRKHLDALATAALVATLAPVRHRLRVTGPGRRTSRSPWPPRWPARRDRARRRTRDRRTWPGWPAPRSPG